MARSMTIHVRPARASDHPLFARLFPELETDDAVLEPERFVRELMPTTVVAEVETGQDARPVGYAHFQIMKELAYVRHIVTAPEARRTGVGRALMTAILARAREAGTTAWCLNVKPDNTPAIALYEAYGMKPAHRSRVVSMPWASVDAAAAAPAATADAGVVARLIAPEDDARVESAASLALLPGQVATNRAIGDRVLMMLEEDGQVVGATSFAPSFPGAYPFRVARPALALVLLRAIRPHARPVDLQIQVVTENQPDVADALLAAGARIKLEMLHMKGALPPA